MQAVVGDRLLVHGNIVGHPERTGEIVEVRAGNARKGRRKAESPANRHTRPAWSPQCALMPLLMRVVFRCDRVMHSR